MGIFFTDISETHPPRGSCENRNGFSRPAELLELREKGFSCEFASFPNFA